MNRIIILGRLVRDPEVHYTPSGRVACQFTLAVDRPFTNQEGQKEADFIPVVIWGKSAETAGNNLTKGQRALVEGRLQIRSYEAKDGSKRYVTEVIAERFEFIERKGDTSNTGTSGAQNYTPAQNSQQKPSQASAFDSMGKTVFDDDIPF